MSQPNRREMGLLSAREIYGIEAEEALREHLELYDERFYLWLADLYLPRDVNGRSACSGGGFYYSNSARDTDGYEIDLESTRQVLAFCSSSGMLDGYDGDYKKAFPKEMQNDMCAFAKSLQSSEDGYFYHPQWGKNIKVQRRGKDLLWGPKILEFFGEIPLYDTPIGAKGSLGAPKLSLGSEKNSKERESIWPEHLVTLDAFKKYLSSFDLSTASFSSGNTFTSQKALILARDKQAIVDGEAHDNNGDGIAEDGYVAALQSFINSAQNSENGLWEKEVSYASVNGLMKLGIALDGKLNYAEKSFKSAIEILLLPGDTPDVNGKLAKTSPDVYNPWIIMQVIMKNVKQYGTEEEYQNILSMLKENAPDLIRATTEKTRKFKKADGSFGYTWTTSPTFSQGAPICPEGFVEGDVNGGIIAVTGVFHYMTTVLGLDIPIYNPSDFEKFIARIKAKYK